VQSNILQDVKTPVGVQKHGVAAPQYNPTINLERLKPNLQESQSSPQIVKIPQTLALLNQSNSLNISELTLGNPTKV
jgi:hypothetical protein